MTTGEKATCLVVAGLPIDESVDAVTFPLGLPGFPGERTFIIETPGDAPLVRLRSDGPSFVVLTDPGALFPALSPLTLDDDAVEVLGTDNPTDLAIWVILTSRGPSVTANLLGPVVVNQRNGLAVQVISRDPSASICAPLPAEQPAITQSEVQSSAVASCSS